MKMSPLRLCAAAALMAFAAACDEPADTRNASAGRGDSTASANNGAASTAATADPSLTLPVLDALFFEDGFEADLKQRLSLTDAQVGSLKTAAREAVENLTEDGGASGSSRSAARAADERVRSILGDAKAGELYGYIQQRYAGGDVGGVMSTEPNALPTDTRIVVNAPAYRMDVFQDGKLTKTYKVGIGYPEFPLPTGMRRAENIIFNPTWTPPDEPWVKGKFQPGKKVEAGSKDNPLGYIKIPIGMPSLIHGGKQPTKLGTFASHGCVGLTNEQVQDFAQVLAGLGGTAVSPEEIRGYEQKRTETKDVKLTRPIPVELRYETIVVEAGTLRIYRDVYERGTNTIENLQRVLSAHGLAMERLPADQQAAIRAALDEMNRDAKGNPISEAEVDSARDAKPTTSSKKTTTIVGRKEIAIPLPAAQGKGYPAPVALNTGGAPADTASRTPAARPRR